MRRATSCAAARLAAPLALMTAAALAQLQLDAPLYIVNSSAVLDRFPFGCCQSQAMIRFG